jgi:hypothetical protein
MSKKVPDGYVVEFCIPSSQLRASTMAAGTKFGFNYCIDIWTIPWWRPESSGGDRKRFYWRESDSDGPRNLPSISRV